MTELLSDKLIHKIQQAAGLYYRLVVLVGPAGAGKTATLKTLHELTKAPYVNVNLELAQRMLELTERQRVLQLKDLLAEIVALQNSEVVLLDNMEVLFDRSLQQDPLRLLTGLSRNKTVVAAWNGNVKNQHLYYAVPNHPEYRSYPIKDFLIVAVDNNS